MFTVVNKIFNYYKKNKYNRYYLSLGKPEDGIIYIKPNILIRTYSYNCPDLGCASADTVSSVSSYFNNLIKILGNGWSIQFESIRKNIFDKENYQYKNLYFLTLIYKFKYDFKFINSYIEKELQHFKDISENSIFFAKSRFQLTPLNNNEILKFLEV